MNRTLTNRIAIGVLWGAALLTVAVLGALLLYVFVNGIRAISLEFIFTWPRGVNAEGGIWPTIVATVYVTALAMLISTPVSVLAAVYLAEYAHQGRIVSTIRFAADSLASVPSIVMGLFGFALFVEAMGLGLSMISAALALSLLMLPIIMRATEEAIRSVPKYMRWGAYGLGATKWQVVRRTVLPAAAPRIITGHRAGDGPRRRVRRRWSSTRWGRRSTCRSPRWMSGRPMTVHLYLLAVEGINLPAAFGTALLLILMILGFNLSARWILARYRKV